MKTLNCSPETAEDGLVALSRHLPLTVEIGRPTVACLDNDGVIQVLTTDGATWWAYPDRAVRLVPLRDGLAEATEWCAGFEISRYIGRVG
ncbi:hypothetical protein BS329_39920 [Amycolatopsis coloradensis]|uniref:Uncharacterized protein n=1 Tax=Amycolatopsis coloradensis TaxID=76021 RepID=A0A1R0KE22_9PSEU|nr:hypothetical protein [Amycolatopsis coloradensis]OLZ43258.1 hypothetical protein BS329_39920 [Amycolatopsis coloradensis]